MHKASKEQILAQLGENPTDQQINEVHQQTKVSAMLIKQWIMFAKKIKQRQLGQDETPQGLDFYQSVKESKLEPEEPQLQLLEKKTKTQEKPQKKDIKQYEKKQKIIEKQYNERKPEIIYQSDPEQQIRDSPEGLQKQIGLPAYYMIKLELNLMEQAINMHKKIVKIIESKFDYLNIV